MAKLNVRKSIYIEAPASLVYPELAEFHNWRKWSPWLIMEPDASVTIAESGKSYEWEGDLTGSGNMAVHREKENSQIDYKLEFLKPWKSKADVSFFLKENDSGTEVTWTMDSPWPFFLFWMRAKTEAFIGMDYDRGLLMLKSYIEKGHIPAQLTDLGSTDFSSTSYIGLKRTCSYSDMQKSMSQDFAQLKEYAKNHPDTVTGDFFSIYHKFDVVNDLVEYTAGVPVNAQNDAPSNFISGALTPKRTHRILLTGDYNFLGNAWALGMTMQRNKKFKSDKKHPPFEVYTNDPSTTPKEEWKTEVHFPVV